ncbi:MATE family efflux transporter [bacterium D16-51]|nr:MATE family efflux transporter [bacterium D16-59]RKI62087.1 MATE family efflux transporter [bacterium D16-51]
MKRNHILLPQGRELRKRWAFLAEFFSLAVPIMLQQLSGNILNICDTIMIGKVSDKAISGVTVANKTYFIYSLLVFGITSGISMFMSQQYGAKQFHTVKRTFCFGIKICLAAAAAFLVFLLILPEKAIELFVSGEEIIQLGTDYIKIARWSYIPAALSWMSGVYYRIYEKQKLPMAVGMASVLLNVLFNYVFIYGNWGMPAMGIKGAALATTLSRYIEFFILFAILIAFYNGKEIFTGKKGKLCRKEKLLIIRKTIPLMVNEGIWAAALSLVFKNYCYVSEADIPAITVVDNVFDMMNVAYVGCSMASGIITGKILGSGKMKEAWKTAKRLIFIGLAVSASASILICLTAGIIPKIFSLSGSLFVMSATLLRIKAAFSWSQGYGETIYYILRAGGDVKAVLFIDGLFNLYGPLLVSTVAAYGADMPIQAVYLCTEATYLLKIFIATFFFKKGRWCNNLAAK